MRSCHPWFGALTALCVCLSTSIAFAQDAAAPRARGKAKRQSAARTEVKVEAAKGSAAQADGEAESATDTPADDASAPADGVVRTEGDTQVKVMEFSGLDIEGQLKTPQMLYFLNRLRAEFGRPRLPHRSFMPELRRSAHDRALK